MGAESKYLIAATAAASLNISTSACALGGYMVYCSAAAGTFIIKDSARTILTWSGAAAATLSQEFPGPCICTGGLSVTNSGACHYTIAWKPIP